MLAAGEMGSLMKDPLSMKWLRAISPVIGGEFEPDGGDGLAVPVVRLEVVGNSDTETSNGKLFG